MYRGVVSRDLIIFKRSGRFPPSQVPVFSDPEVMEYEGMEPTDFSPTQWLNVTKDPENAKGYGSVLIWIRADLCDLTPSKNYGVVPVKAITLKTQGQNWDFVQAKGPQFPAGLSQP